MEQTTPNEQEWDLNNPKVEGMLAEEDPESVRQQLEERQTVVNVIKDLRLVMHQVAGIMEGLNTSKPLVEAHSNFVSARMWTGKMLQCIEGNNPYPQSRNPANRTIEPAADTTGEQTLTGYEGLGQVETIKWLRARLSEFETILKQMHFKPVPKAKDPHWLWEHIRDGIRDLQRANNWLGMELGRLRDEQTEQAKITVQQQLG